jgi:hypothetical protein
MGASQVAGNDRRCVKSITNWYKGPMIGKDTFFEMAKSDVKTTIVSYFSPVRAVIAEVSKAVSAETDSHDRADEPRLEKNPSA